MLLFFGIQLVPVGYAVLYLKHSLKKRRRGQAAAIAALLLFDLLACALLLWEFLSMP